MILGLYFFSITSIVTFKRTLFSESYFQLQEVRGYLPLHIENGDHHAFSLKISRILQHVECGTISPNESEGLHV
jgi:hypothetical protein